MGIDKIKSKILEDATAEANKIIEEAKKEKEEILKKAEEEAKKRKEEILKRGEKEAELLKNRIIAEAKLEAKKKLLKAREEIIEKAIEKLREDLKKLPESDKYQDILYKLTVDAINVLGEEEEYYAKINERDIELIKNIEKELKYEFGKNIKLNVETANIIGGIILENIERTKLVDNSLEAVFERKLPEIRIKIVEKLF
ncbi:V-type ATP synthase subunit E [Methanocaldococcus indicus]|uniref:V-type ATP synthase subunit E n=1 Tax=Methanocaldococcus indicus TaxID=213231 RepID=UPI003C6CF8A6